MLSTSQLSVAFGSKVLFEDVSLKFFPGECYGLIGANGAGKSTFLKVLSGELDSSSGNVIVEDGRTISVLSQDQFAFDDHTVMSTVLMGDKKLYPIYKERMDLYSKSEMTEKEGERIGDLEEQFGELDGYVAEADAAKMLNDLGISESFHDTQMGELEAAQKIRVLLAQALFGNPDILLLDEPTNQLDYLSVLWLEKYLLGFKNIVIVVSHDRHFLNKVCTHIADVDFGEIKLYPGNYEFWQQSSQLAVKQRQDDSLKSEAKIKELEAFVRRFSANASKSKQATSRKKLIEKLRPDQLPVSKRRTPFIQFSAKNPCSQKVLKVTNVTHKIGDETVLSNVSFELGKRDKIAIVGQNSVSKTTLLDILSGVITPDEGEVEWADNSSRSYFPKDNSDFFEENMPLINWLEQFDDSGEIQILRGFLGRMLFSGDDVDKMVNVLSGGEKARAMFSKMMIAESNTLLFDEPTDHLDLESIGSLNDGLVKFKECLIFTSHDFQLLNSVANRVIEVSPKGMLDRNMEFDDYMNSETIKEQKLALY